MPDIGVSGGLLFEAKLKDLARRLGKSKKLRMGFLENATMPDGTPAAYIAVINEFGATIQAGARTQVIYRKLLKNGAWGKAGRFVKANSKGAVAQDVDVAEHTIVIPARPFFRQMIAKNKGTWGAELVALMKSTDYDAERALALMGHHLGEQLQQSIIEFANPPNAPSTIRKKGFNKPLVDKGDMKNSVGSDVT